MGKKILFYIIIIILISGFHLLIYTKSLPAQNKYEQSGFKIIKLWEINLPGEGDKDLGHWNGEKRGNIRFFDRKHRNNMNAIAVVINKKLYILDTKGNLLHATDFYEEALKRGLQTSNLAVGGNSKDINQIKFGKFQKDGYYDTIVFPYYTCGPWFYLYDGLGSYIGSIDQENCTDNSTFMLKDVNGDGIDEFLHNGRAFFTKDGGVTWQELWRNESLTERYYPHIYFKYGCNLDYRGGFVGYYDDSLVAVDNKGEIIFKFKMGQWLKANYKALFVTGDFHGNGLKDGIVAINTDNKGIYYLNKEGVQEHYVPAPSELLKGGNGLIKENIQAMVAGKLRKSDSTDSVVICGLYGIAAFNSKGGLLWLYEFPERPYSKWFSSFQGVYNLFISDLDGDGESEIVAGAVDNQIYVLSNKGKLITKIAVDGYLLGGFGSTNPTMDIVEMEYGKLKEIAVFTSAGTVYGFVVQKKE